MIEIYTDGACSGNGRANPLSGWAFVVLIDGKPVEQGNGAICGGTNNIAELTAIAKGLEYLKTLVITNFDEIKVYTDSAYCCNCWKDSWWKKWLDNGWRTSKKEPVANKELWEELIPWFRQSQFNMIKVKGHDGNYYNELVDVLAVKARETLINSTQ